MYETMPPVGKVILLSNPAFTVESFGFVPPLYSNSHEVPFDNTMICTSITFELGS